MPSNNALADAQARCMDWSYKGDLPPGQMRQRLEYDAGVRAGRGRAEPKTYESNFTTPVPTS